MHEYLFSFRQKKIAKLKKTIAKGGIKARAAKAELDALMKAEEADRAKREISEKIAKKKADKSEKTCLFLYHM